MIPLEHQLTAVVTSHRASIRTLARFVTSNRKLLTDLTPTFPPASEAARHARLPAIYLSTMPREEVDAHQRFIANLIQQEEERQVGIKRLSQDFPNLLLQMSLIYRVGLFDAFINDVQSIVLIANPYLLKSEDRKLNFTNIVEQVLRDNLIEHMAEMTVASINRRSIREQFQKIRSRLHINFEVEDVILSSLTEFIARRNIFTHANGVVNSAYLGLVPYSSHEIGTQLDVPYDYWAEGDRQLRVVCDQLLKSIFARYCNGISPPPALSSPE